MKQYLIMAVAAMATLTVFSQEKTESKNVKAPAAAEAAFKKSFPAATKVKWEKEGANYEVNFLEGKKEMAAVYGETGNWIETEEEIAISALPASVDAYVKQQKKGSIKEASKITKANGEINYEAEVNKQDLIFDKDGKFIKVEKD
ncbi:PepSY-like domain-containing protein [Pinibacter aurantiacus]|uniref:PepSY-like domain-containing protein n=1 Tax=Pinibacter aurantiacus TaxID=2851599 RepID=A0A9E2SET0_9BACT|nr:PepSY-like domain-containing protein [Pinibacter aurantiacus]MBV4360444.1 PepSY-like domain-containing protein [Pinibacter aurantiacus]